MTFKDIKENIVNRLSPSKKEYENAVSQMVNAIKQQHSLYRKEIGDWKTARFVALNSERPRRKFLIDLYEDIMTDAFVWGRCDTRKLRISNKGFAIVDASGEINEEKTKFIQKRWMNEFVKYAVESVYYGYSLLYPSELDDNGLIKKISLVYRDHVVPERKEILKEVHDMKGVRFDEPPYDRWCVFINHEGFLGLLDKAAPLWIFKKHSWQNWDEFEEMYGIPIRTAKVASTDKRVLAEVDKWLKDLGSAAYGRFPEGVEIDIKESKSRDAFNVFNEKRKAANEELATLIDGHFETAKDTGSRAKTGSIIESTQALITLDDETRVQFIINDDLMPMLRQMGYPFAEDDQFVWNDNEQLTRKERMEIFKGVKDLGYRVKKEQVENEMDVEIEEEKAPPNLPKGEGPANRITDFNLPHNHSDGCGAHLETYREINFNLIAKLTDDEEDFLRQLWENPGSIDWNYKEFKASHGKLLHGLRTGFGAVDFDFESEDHNTMRMFQNNIHRFATDKTQKEVFDLNKILKDPKVDSFSKFRERAKTLFPNYKEHWLRAEYDQAMSSSQMGARYLEMMENADIAPFWRLNATIDGGTTQICRGLDGKVFRKDNPDTWQFLPPNHWRCRSDAEDVLEGYDGELSDMTDAVNTDPDGWERMKKSGFDVNWGDEKQVFSATQSYLAKLNIPPMDIENMPIGLFPLVFGKKNLSGLPTNKMNFARFADRSGNARFFDAFEMPLWLEKSVFDEMDEKLRPALPETLSQADEIFWNGKFEYRYLKYYEEGTVMAKMTHGKNVPAMIVGAQLGDAEEFRKGLLVFTPEARKEARKQRYKAYGNEYKKFGFEEGNGGYLVIHKKRISRKGLEKEERQIFEKEKSMSIFLKNHGYEVEMLEEVPRVSGPDILLNGIPADLKKTRSANNIMNYAKKAIGKQGAEIVIIEFEVENQKIYNEIEALKQEGIKLIYFFSGKNEIYKNY